MDKFRIFGNIEDKEERMFLSFVYDKLLSSEKKSYPGFTDFCSPSQKAYIKAVVSKEIEGVDYISKIINSERLIPSINHDYAEIPTDIVMIKELNSETANHRDVLGSLMSLGIKRCKIGDIIIDDKVYFEVKNEITPYILSNLIKIKNRNVHPEIFTGQLEKKFAFEEIPMTVSSLRADCIISGITGLSRENAKNLIVSGKISVNSIVFENPSKNLSENDVISIRGYGKFIFGGVFGETKKERLKIIIKKYI